MGVLPCQFAPGENAATWNLTGDELFDLVGIEDATKPRQNVVLFVHRRNGAVDRISLTLRLDTPTEVDFARQGGIMPYVLSELVAGASAPV
jgi:aconitate hydratase